MCTVIIYSTSKSRGNRIHCMWNLLWQTIPDYVSLPLCSGSWSFHYWLELLINSSCKWQNRVGSHLPMRHTPSPGTALRETGCWIVGWLGGCKIQGEMLLLYWGEASCWRPRKDGVWWRCDDRIPGHSGSEVSGNTVGSGLCLSADAQFLQFQRNLYLPWKFWNLQLLAVWHCLLFRLDGFNFIEMHPRCSGQRAWDK